MKDEISSFGVGRLNFNSSMGSTLMPNEYRGELHGGDRKFAIVVSRYNESITGKLLAGAVETLSAAGIADDAIDVVWVPGAFEIPRT